MFSCSFFKRSKLIFLWSKWNKMKYLMEFYFPAQIPLQAKSLFSAYNTNYFRQSIKDKKVMSSELTDRSLYFFAWRYLRKGEIETPNLNWRRQVWRCMPKYFLKLPRQSNGFRGFENRKHFYPDRRVPNSLFSYHYSQPIKL